MLIINPVINIFWITKKAFGLWIFLCLISPESCKATWVHTRRFSKSTWSRDQQVTWKSRWGPFILTYLLPYQVWWSLALWNSRCTFLQTWSHDRWVPWFIKKFIRKLLTSFMEQFWLLSKHQFGFHKRGNTKQVAALFVDSIIKNMNSDKMICVLTCQKHLTLWFIHKLSQNLSRYCITSIEKELLSVQK